MKLEPVGSAAGMLLPITSPPFTGKLAGKVFRVPAVRS
jgi:hypothetical protein